MKQMALIGLWLFGCSAAGGGPGHVVPPLVLSPAGIDPQLVVSHAQRWGSATGLTIEVGDGGAPVAFGPMLYERNAGETAVKWRSGAPSEILWIHIDERRDHDHSLVSHILLHEMGHAVCEHGINRQAENRCHSKDRGLMHESADSVSCIDAASLATVCSHRGCHVFVPEC